MKKFPKKILLLSPIPPCSNYSGGLVLKHLARFLPQGSLVCVAVMNKYLKPQIPGDLQWIPTKYIVKPHESWPDFGFRIGHAISFLGETYIQTLILKRIANEINDFGRKRKVDCLWSVLDGTTTIRLAVQVAKKLRVPMLTEIWDPPEWYNKINNLDPINTYTLFKNFGTARRLSKKLAAASIPMAKRYHQKYGVNAIPFFPWLDRQSVFEPATKIHSRKEFIIGVAGQIYSIAGWNALVEALRQVDWLIGDKEIKIRVLGNWIHLQTSYKMSIEYLGYRTQQETVELMNDCDLLYCPYWFERHLTQVARLSFPSKLTTYLASGRPVFYHGHSYASPGVFLKKNKAALLCHTLNCHEIIQLLKSIISDQKLYASLARNGHLAFKNHMTFDILHQKFAEFLEVPETDLLLVK